LAFLFKVIITMYGTMNLNIVSYITLREEHGESGI